MAAITWKPNANGYWTAAANWSGGVVPGSADAVTLTSAAAHTIYFNTTDTVTSLSSTNDLLAVQGGTLTVSSTLALAGGLTETGGVLNLSGTSNTIAGPVSISAGDVGIATGKTLTLSGTGVWGAQGSSYGARIHGAGTLATTGNTTIADYGGTAEAVLGGGLIWNNTGVVNQAGTIEAFYTPGTALTINNAAGATFNLIGDDASIANGTIYNQNGVPQVAGSAFTNAGTLSKTGGTGVSRVYSVLTNTGTLNAASGTLELDGGGTLAGTVKGAGTVSLGGGNFTIAGNTAVSVATFAVNGAVLKLGGNLALANTLAVDAGAIELNGDTLSAVSAYFGAGTIDGSGTLLTSGTSTLINLTLGGGANWINSGTVNDTNSYLYLADANGAGTLTNQAGASFNITTDAGVQPGNGVEGRFVNAGTLAKTGGTGTTDIYATVTNTGTIVAASGTLEFDGSGTFGGTITGAGTVAFSSWSGQNSVTIAAGTTITVANLAIQGATVTLNESLAYAGALALNNGALELNGYNVSVNNAYLGSTVDGLGTLTTSGTTTIGGATIGGGAQWVNTGVVNASNAYLYLADGSGAGTITNQAGASFNFTTDPGTQPSNNSNGSFTNAGTLAKTGGTGTTNIYATVNNAGTITAASGVLEFDGGGSFGGTIGGAGTVAFGNWNGLGADTLVAGTTLSVANLLIDGGYLTLGQNVAYAGNFALTSGVLELNGHNFTTSNAYLNATVDGPGTLTTGGTTTVGGFTVGGGTNWVNTGTVNQSGGYVYLADGSGAGTITNRGGASFNFTTDVGTQPTNGTGGSFTNAGTLAKTGGTGTTLVYATVTSTGTVTAASGTLEFDGGGSFGGTISGAGTVAFGNYNNLGYASIAAGTTVSVANLLIDGGQLTLNESVAYAGAFSLSSGTLELNGYNFSAQGASLYSLIDGAGTLTTSGTTTAGTVYIGGGANWVNTGTVNQGNGYIYDGDANGGGTITNAAGAKFNFTTDASTQPYNPEGNFVNAGTLTKTGGTGTSNVYMNVTSTGAIGVSSGTLEFDGGGSFSGNMLGTGTINLSSYYYQYQQYSLGALTVASTVNLNLGNSSYSYYYADLMSLTGAVKIAGTLNSSGTAITMNGQTITVTGAANFGTNYSYYAAYDTSFDGTGTLLTTGTTTVIDDGGYDAMGLSGGAAWNNTGKVLDGGLIQVAGSDGGGAITNAATGTFSLTSDDASVTSGTSYDIYGNQISVYGSFTNAGLLAKTAGTGTSTVNAVINNTGTLQSNGTGILALADGGKLGGKIAAGTVALNGGDFTLNGLTVAGTLADNSQADQTGTVTLGSGTAKGFLTVGGIYNFDNDGTLALGVAGSTVTIASGGLLSKIAGTGTSTVAEATADNGAIAVQSGTLVFSLAVTGAGTASVANGAKLEFGSTVQNTIAVTLGNSSTLVLDAPTSFKGSVSNFVAGDVIDLKGITATAATVTSTGVLTVKNGTTTVDTVALTGNHLGDVYTFTADGNGGTLIGISQSTTNWVGGSHDWTTNGAWSAGQPGPSYAATISGTTLETVTLSSGETAAVKTLTLSDANATLALGGTLSVGSTLTSTAGAIQLSGVVNGGTLVVNGGSFAVAGSSNATLSGVAFQGTADLSAYGANLYAVNGTSFAGVGGTGTAKLTITGMYSGLYEQGNVTLANTAVTLGNNSSNASLVAYDPDDSGSLLTLAATSSITQAGSYAALADSGNDTDGVFLSGIIGAAVSGGLFTVSGNLFENDGKILVSNHDEFAINSANFTNAGTLGVSSGTLDLNNANATLGGTIALTKSTLNLGDSITTTRLLGMLTSADTVNLSTTLNNAGSTLDLTKTAIFSGFTLDNGGIINGGTLVLPGGTLAVASGAGGELLGVTVDGGLVVNSGSLDLQGTQVLNAAGTAPGAISVGAGGTVALDGYTTIANNVTLGGGTLYVSGADLVDNLSTGIDANGNDLPGGSADPNWSVSTTSAPAVVLSTLFSGWGTDGPGQWVGVVDSTSEPPPPYSFTETFTLTAAQVASQILLANWSVDNGGTLLLNGNAIASTTLGAEEAVRTPTDGIGVLISRGLQVGTNTLTIALTGGDGLTDGVRFSGGMATPIAIAAGTVVQGTGLVTDHTDGVGAIANQGTIAANVTGGTLDVAPSYFVNQATMTATNGATLMINAPVWSNTGTINVNAATLDLGGSFATADTAGITDTGGTVNITGFLNNAGGTLAVGTGSVLGTVTLTTGSVVTSGTIADAGGGIAFTGDNYSENTGPTLDGVTYQGTLNVTQTNETVFIADGIGLTGVGGTGAGSINLTGLHDRLEFTTSTTLDNATISIGTASPDFGDGIDMYDASQSLTLTLGSKLSVIDNTANTDANFGDPITNGSTLVNNGLIAATASNATVFLDSLSLVNSGTLQATNGGLIDLSAANGAIGQAANFTNLSGLVLTGGSYFAGPSGTIELGKNAQIGTDAANITLSGANSEIQSYNGSAQVTIEQSLTTIDKTGSLSILGNRTFTSTLAVSDAGRMLLGGSVFKSGSLTVTATGTLAGFGNVSDNVVNSGLIEATSAGTLVVAGATGTGAMKIDASSKLDIANAASATQTVTFGGVGAMLKIDNPTNFKAVLAGFGPGDAIDFTTLASATATVSGTTMTVKSGTTTYTETINALPAGTVLVAASDGKTGTVITAYQVASASQHTPEPVAFGNHHVGDTLTQALSITNTAPANGYSEGLDGSIATISAGITTSGSFTQLAAGATSSALSVSLASSKTGAAQGTATISLATDGAAVDKRGTVALASQSVAISGALYAYAAAALNSSTVAFGNVHVGDTINQGLTLTNSTPASSGYAEALDASIAATTGAANATGAVNLLAAGTASTGLSVGLQTASAGAVTGNATIALASDGAGTSGLGVTTLPSQTVAVSGTVYAEAAPVLGSTAITLGNVHVGATDSTALSLTNATTNAAYTEGLDASFTGTTGAATDAGSLGLLAAGATDTSSLTVGVSTASAGLISGTATLGLTSDGQGTSGLANTALPTQTVAVSGAVYALATPSLAATSYNAGVVHVGDSVSQALSLTNTAANPAYTETLDAGITGTTGSVTSTGSVNQLAAGATDSSDLVLALNTATSGAVSGSATLGLTSDGQGTSGLGTTALASQSVNLAATVDNYAVATVQKVSAAGTLTLTAPNAYTLNLGSVLQGAAASTITLEVLNSATGLADLLGGNFTITHANSAILSAGLTAFSGKGAGAADTTPAFRLATTTAGTFSETISIATTGSNASGYSAALSPITLTVTGIVAQTYTLTTGQDTISAGGGNDLVVATSGTLSAGDAINGGVGVNTLQLSGGGVFDLSQPASLLNIQAVTAQEATGTAAQTVTLRAGYTGTITATSGAAGSGITIIGAKDSAVIKLGSGNDTVTVGATTETITAGAGNSVINVTAATIGAKITGATFTNTLDVSGGGTVAMGSTMTGFAKVVVDDTNVSGTVLTANATKPLAITSGAGSDTITFGSAGQSLVAGSGTTTVKGVIADAGNLVTNTAGGTTTLELTTGGTGILNAGDSGITVKLDAATNLGLSTASFITAIGAASGTETLTAGAANQTLQSSGATDTLVGSSSYGDSFVGTASTFAHDTLKAFGGTDHIDLTDLMYSSFQSLGYTGNTTQGKLSITDGTHTGSVTLLGSYTAANFTVSADAQGGTLIGWTH